MSYVYLWSCVNASMNLHGLSMKAEKSHLRDFIAFHEVFDEFLFQTEKRRTVKVLGQEEYISNGCTNIIITPSSWNWIPSL